MALATLTKVSGPNGELENGADEAISLSLPAVLGRGSLLKCAETKVSRRHSTLDWDEEDGVIIEAVHVNPTYLVISGKQSTIKKGQTAVLHNGDLFGLLPTTAWYRVNLPDVPTLPHEDKSTMAAVQDSSTGDALTSAGNAVTSPGDSVKTEESVKNLEENKTENVPNGKEVKMEEDKSVDKLKDEQNKLMDCTNPSDNKVSETVKVEPSIPSTSTHKPTPAQPATTNRTRVLPAWMNGLQDTPNTDSKPATNPRVSPQKKKRPAVQAKKRGLHDLSESEDDETINSRTAVTPAKAAKRSPVKKQAPSPKVTTPARTSGANHAMSDSEDEEVQGFPLSSPPRDDDDTAPSADTPSAGAASTSTPARATAGNGKRKSCMFGKKCYRKNPVHKATEAHPGDSDYDSETADDRPECEYGTNCYRRNRQHRAQYKHTALPERKARRKARQRQDDGDADSDDSYDYDDPFLNDGSSDDYAPTDSESDSEYFPSQPMDEEEDVRRMKKEAKKFVGKRR